MRREEEIGASTPAPNPLNRNRRVRRLISGISAIAALVLVTVTVAALFATHTGASRTPAGTPASPAATPFGSQRWSAVPGLTNLPFIPQIAPSNPQIVYGANTRQAILRRSDDQGAHWTDLNWPLPVSQAVNASFWINPNNAQNIVLFVNFPPDVQYFSTDGGAHWALMNLSGLSLPSPSAGTCPVSGFLEDFFAQENRIYGDICAGMSDLRLVMSTDDGTTWRFADAALQVQGRGMCNFAAVPTGSTVFAFTCSPQESSGEEVWRSDDAGAHWALVSTFPGRVTAYFGAFSSSGAQPTLVTETVSSKGALETDILVTYLVSTDGGKTWQPIPTRGIPPPKRGFSEWSFLGIQLRDGSFLDLYESGLSLYAWKPGERAWHQITPSLPNLDGVGFVLSSGEGHDFLWAIGGTGPSSDIFSVVSYTIT